MSTQPSANDDLAHRISARLLDVLIRAALLGVLAALCIGIFAPFLTLMAWAVVLAIAFYPLHQMLARRIGGKQGLAATLIVVLGCVLIIAPSALLMSSFGTSVKDLVTGVQQNTLEIPAPRESVKTWPVVGEKVYGAWSLASSDLPALVKSMQPKVGNLARTALGVVANIGIGILKFLVSFIIAGILMAFGETGSRASVAIFDRILTGRRGAAFASLATATIRAVAQGVIGIAFIQALLVGVVLIVAGVPWAGVLAAIVLVLSIAQIPALIVILPVLGYIWTSGSYGTGAAILYTVLLLLAGLADNVLKPLMLGRGVDVPMPVVLLGALGGMAGAGILGMFLGATLLALGYQIFWAWVEHDPDAPRAVAPATASDPTPPPAAAPTPAKA